MTTLYPEDELFDPIRSFTARRLASIETSTSGQTPDKISDIFGYPEYSRIGYETDGPILNIASGLWMQPTDSWESINETVCQPSSKLGPCSFFTSLHSYTLKSSDMVPGKSPPHKMVLSTQFIFATRCSKSFFTFRQRPRSIRFPIAYISDFENDRQRLLAVERGLYPRNNFTARIPHMRSNLVKN